MADDAEQITERYIKGAVPPTIIERQERIANAGLTAIQAHPDYQEGDKIVIGIDRDDTEQDDLTSSVGAAGYDGTADLFLSLMEHARAVIESTGTGKLGFEQQRDGSWIVRIRFGSDVAEGMSRAIAAKFHGGRR